MRKPQGKRVRPAKQRGTWRKPFISSKNKDKTTFYSPVEAKVPVFISTSPDERMFVIDSRASMHMLSKRELSSAEMDTLRRSRTPVTVVTANGEVQTTEEA